MLRRPTLLFIMLAHAGLIQTLAAQHATPPDSAAIADLIARTEAANNAGDVEAWVDLFADDAVYMAPGAPPVTTRAGLSEVARAGFRHQARIRIVPQEVEVSGSWAFARNHVSGSVQLAGSGETVPVDVKQIVIYRRSDRGWRIARLISNSNR